MANERLTVDDLRAYLERRVERCKQTADTLAEFAQSEPVHSHAYTHRLAERQATVIRQHAYQKLIDIIDRDELPE